jgi:lipoprotein-releasing system permease protein
MSTAASATGTARNGELNGRAHPFGVFERSVASRYLRARRAHGGVALISIISFVGIMLAVAVLIVVMSVMNGFRHDLLERLLGAQGHVFVYSAFSDQAGADEMTERLVNVPGVLRAAPVISGQAGVLTADAFSGVQIYGLAREDLETLTLVREGVRLGSIENFGQGERGGDGILIGNQLANRLGLTVDDPVTLISPSTASTIMGPTFRKKTYYVDAIFSVGMSQIDELFVYLPIEQARIFLDRDYSIADFIEVSISNPDDVDTVRRRLALELGSSAALTDWRDNYASYVGALNVERNVMRLILGMLVLIAALNIISGLVMLAKNKSGDIAILRTVGATRGSIMRIFFLVGATIGILGTAAGITLGTLFCLNIGFIQKGVEAIFGPVFPDDIYFLSQIPARIEWSEVAVIAAWGFLMSCVATLPPAWNAARLDPVEALRYG